MKNFHHVLIKSQVLCFTMLLLASCGEEKPNSSSIVTSKDSTIDSQSVTVSSSESKPAGPKQASFAFVSTYNPSKIYDGEPVLPPFPEEWVTDSDGSAVVTFLENGVTLEEAPTDAGSYTVQVEISATENYLAVTGRKDFVIAKANPNLAFVEGYSLDMVYNGNAVATPTEEDYTTKSDGVVTYHFYEGEAPLENAPKEVGNYRLVLTQEETKNYLAGEATLSFHITKAALADFPFLEGSSLFFHRLFLRS